MAKQWRPIEQATAWAIEQGITSIAQWRARSKEPDFPDDLPPNPDYSYKPDFIEWGIFLGTGTVAPQKREYRSYAEASKWAQEQGIRNQKDWQARSKDPDFPTDIPKNLKSVYKDEFIGLGDFLGNGVIAAQNRVYRSYEQASQWAHEQGLTTRAEWQARAKMDDFPSDLPADPRRVYGDQFPGWPEFLQSGRLSNRARTFVSYKEASSWAQAQGITSREMWRERAAAPDFPTNIPKNPSETYGNEFEGWGPFTGTERKANHERTFRSYLDASAWAQEQGITSALSWVARSKAADFPDDLPVAPYQTYGDEFRTSGGWMGFLNQTRLSGSSKIEKALKRGLSAVLDLDPSNRAKVTYAQEQRPLVVDMVDRQRRLVIEYDGWFWHHQAKKEVRDRHVSAMLTQADEPWTVIRVREAPLALLHDKLDVGVPLPNGKFGPTIQRVLQHLHDLAINGVIPDQGLSAKIKGVLNHNIQENTFNDLFQMGWAPYEQASQWARQQGIKNQLQWLARTKQADFPENFPKYPDEAYGAAFGTWGTFLGTGTVASNKKVFRSYEEAEKWAREQGIKSAPEWRQHRKLGHIPEDIPYNPDKVYKGIFKHWGTFLGTGTVANAKRVFLSYEEASSWAKAERIQSEPEWRERCKRADFPRNIPQNLNRHYKKQFLGYGDFLGTGAIAPKNRMFRSCEEASQWAQENGIRSESQWRRASKSKILPMDLPSRPDVVYPDFPKWGNFLNTSNLAPKEHHARFRSYNETMTWARAEGIATAQRWQERCKAPDFPDDIPSHPERFYKEFPGWGTFLNNGNVSNAKRSFRSCEEAAQWAQSQNIVSQEDWRARTKLPDFPTDIPKAPDQTYKGKFPGWPPFLQTERFFKHQEKTVLTIDLLDKPAGQRFVPTLRTPIGETIEPKDPPAYKGSVHRPPPFVRRKPTS